MKSIGKLVVVFFFMGIGPLYKYGGVYFWLYLFSLILFFLLHVDARFLLKKKLLEGITYISTNYFITISSSVAYLTTTMFFVIYLNAQINLIKEISTSPLLLALIYLELIAHVFVPIYFFKNFIKSFLNNKNDYIALSNNFIEKNDNGSKFRIELEEFNKANPFVINGFKLKIGDKILNLENIGISQISIKKLELYINNYYKNIH